MKVHSHECRDRERERDVSERSRVAENASSLEKGARAGKDKIFDGIDGINTYHLAQTSRNSSVR